MPDNQIIALADDLLVLRPFALDDAPALFEAVQESLAELGRWLSWCHPDYSLEDSQQFLASRAEAQRKEEEFALAILERSTGQLWGGCGINQFDRAGRRVNLGYWVRTSAAGRGVASRATALVARWAFETLGLQRVEIVAAVGNLASQRVAQKVGATRECVARHRLCVHGVPTDAVVFSLIRGDLP
jgi:ribosomal-protein-serine acetyltransferase